mgnify:FL=1
MILKRADRFIQEVEILTNKSISVDYLMNVFEATRQTILNDLKELRNKGYNVTKVDWGYYTIK